MLSATLLSALLVSTSLALSIPHAIRAGGPGFVPIPANCSVPNPLPPTSSGPATNYSTNSLSPSPAVVNASQIYSYFLPLPDYESMHQRWEGCLEQCNGLDGCVAAFMADLVPTPEGYYGTPGGVLERACLMFDRALTECDFVTVQEGYVNATAGNIECP